MPVNVIEIRNLYEIAAENKEASIKLVKLAIKIDFIPCIYIKEIEKNL